MYGTVHFWKIAFRDRKSDAGLQNIGVQSAHASDSWFFVYFVYILTRAVKLTH